MNTSQNLGEQFNSQLEKANLAIEKAKQFCKEASAMTRVNWDKVEPKEVRDHLGCDIGNMESFMEQFDEGIDMHISGDYPSQYEVRLLVIENEYLDTYIYSVKNNYGEFLSLNTEEK